MKKNSFRVVNLFPPRPLHDWLSMIFTAWGRCEKIKILTQLARGHNFKENEDFSFLKFFSLDLIRERTRAVRTKSLYVWKALISSISHPKYLVPTPNSHRDILMRKNNFPNIMRFFCDFLGTFFNFWSVRLN